MRNQRGRGSAFARRGSSFYNVSYSSRFRRDCTSKCRLVNVLLPIKVGAFSALLLPALLEPQLNISLEPRSCQLLSACQAQNRLARNILSQRGQRRRVERRAIRVATVYSAMSGPPECPLSRDEPTLPERPRWALSRLTGPGRTRMSAVRSRLAEADGAQQVQYLVWGTGALVAQSPILNSYETTKCPHSSNAEAAQRKLVPETTVASKSSARP